MTMSPVITGNVSETPATIAPVAVNVIAFDCNAASVFEFIAQNLFPRAYRFVIVAVAVTNADQNAAPVVADGMFRMLDVLKFVHSGALAG